MPSDASTVCVKRIALPQGERELPPGARVGDYLIRCALATGGCGTVYLAEHAARGTRAALKVLRADLAGSVEMNERFLREARVVNQIRHPNIVDVFDFGELPDGRPFLVMELLEGDSLASVIERDGRVPPREALAYLEPVACALSAAHALGIVHRDVKPSNVAVVRDAAGTRVKLLDFGIAKLLRSDPGEPALTAVGQRIGTPTAMAPEQIRGVAVDARADIYALGVMAFQLLTGRHPFVAPEFAEIERLHLGAAPPRPGSFAPVGAAIDAVVLRCLEKDPAKRFATVDAFLDAFRGAASLDAAETPLAGPAMAIYVEVRLSVEPDDALLAELGDALDRCERELTSAGFHLHVQTGSALLAISPLTGAAPDARRGAVSLGQRLVSECGSEGRIELSVQAHVDAVETRRGGQGPSFLGGPLLELERWVTEASGFRATPQMIA